MITKEQIAEAAEQYAEQENSAWTNDYNGFVAGANFVLQNLQQCNVSGRSEQLPLYQCPHYISLSEQTFFCEICNKQIVGNCHVQGLLAVAVFEKQKFGTKVKYLFKS